MSSVAFLIDALRVKRQFVINYEGSILWLQIAFCFLTVLTWLVATTCALPWQHSKSSRCDNITFVSRKEWGARPPKQVVHMNTPVTVLFIHHTDGASCHSLKECIPVMRAIQNFHMDKRGEIIAR